MNDKSIKSIIVILVAIALIVIAIRLIGELVGLLFPIAVVIVAVYIVYRLVTGKKLLKTNFKMEMLINLWCMLKNMGLSHKHLKNPLYSPFFYFDLATYPIGIAALYQVVCQRNLLFF